MSSKRGAVLHGRAREIVFNVHKYFENEKNHANELLRSLTLAGIQNTSDDDISIPRGLYDRLEEFLKLSLKASERVALATGVNKNTVTRIKREGNEAEAAAMAAGPSTQGKLATPKKKNKVLRSVVRPAVPIQLEHPFTTGITAALVWRAMEDKETLKKRLTPIQYHVTQEGGTERPFTGTLNKCYDEGMYVCVVCRQDLFSSKTKYDSGCGWPAFNDVLAKEKVKLHKDTSAGLVRTEVRCSKCSAHLGHVFDDGPAPSRKRFCINSASMDFIPAEDRKD